jgi:DNA modification methylase
VKLISISAIKISPQRQRRYFDAAKLHEFADGIQRRGLLHPIILRLVGDDYVLVAGERRLRAIADIHALGGTFKHDGEVVMTDTIPYTLFDELDPLAAKEAELEENIHRENLSWQELAAAHLELKALRTEQAILRGEAPPTVADLTRETNAEATDGIADGKLGMYQAAMRKQLIVAKHLDNPEVAAAKSVEDAFKVLKREDAATKHRELGASVGKTFTADAHRALNEDSLLWMANCPAEQFDVILTDPPYGMGADDFGDSGGLAAGAHGYEDSEENFDLCATVLTRESFRITKPQAHLYCFCDIDWFPYLKKMFTESGWYVWRTPFIWYKRTAMRAPLPEQGPQRKYETILYAVKGKRPTLHLAGDVLDFLPDSNLGHAAQKPVALFTELLRRSVLPGNNVLDPFMGTGTIFAAAHALKCRATGIEMDQASYGIAIKRIEGLRAQQELDLAVGL